jgi:hypothetical protein
MTTLIVSNILHPIHTSIWDESLRKFQSQWTGSNAILNNRQIISDRYWVCILFSDYIDCYQIQLEISRKIDLEKFEHAFLQNSQSSILIEKKLNFRHKKTAISIIYLSKNNLSWQILLCSLFRSCTSTKWKNDDGEKQNQISTFYELLFCFRPF